MIEHLKGLPVQIEHTSFRLTDDEISIITNNENFKGEFMIPESGVIYSLD